MPMRELLWHARAVIDDQAPGKSQIALKYGQDYIGLPPMKQRVRGRAGHRARAGEGDTHTPPVAFVLCGVCQVIARVQALVLQQKIISYTG